MNTDRHGSATSIWKPDHRQVLCVWRGILFVAQFWLLIDPCKSVFIRGRQCLHHPRHVHSRHPDPAVDGRSGTWLLNVAGAAFTSGT
jgi:hypothetical protein